MMAGRKEKYTAAQVAEALRKARGLKYPASVALGCSRQTIDNYAERYATVREVIDDQNERLVDSAELRLIEALEKRGEPWAIALVLKTKGKKRGYVEKTEHDVNHAGRLEVDITNGDGSTSGL